MNPFPEFGCSLDKKPEKLPFDKEFNRQTNARHRTIQTSPNKDVATRQRRINYLKKETQNKIKCLHWN